MSNTIMERPDEEILDKFKATAKYENIMGVAVYILFGGSFEIIEGVTELRSDPEPFGMAFPAPLQDGSYMWIQQDCGCSVLLEAALRSGKQAVIAIYDSLMTKKAYIFGANLVGKVQEEDCLVDYKVHIAGEIKNFSLC